MPWLLERALICERIGWTILPDQLDERNLTLKQALALLRVFRAHQHKSEDLEKITKDEAELIDYVVGLRNIYGHQ